MSQAILQSPRAKAGKRLTNVICVDRLHVDRVHEMAKHANIETEGKSKAQLCKSIVSYWNKKRGRFARSPKKAKTTTKKPKKSPKAKAKKSPGKKKVTKKAKSKKSPKKK